jgi:ADP-ribose pyrophosphatase
MSQWKEKGRVLLSQNKVYKLFRRVIEMPDGTEITRDVFEESGAVAIVALNDLNEIALLEQYRVAINSHVLEIPAGRMDTAETPLELAKREMAEEIDVAAADWYTLVDTWTSPGITNGRVRVYLALNLTDLPPFPRTEEEAEMTIRWINLRKAQEMVFSGEITDGHTVAGILAAHFMVHGRGNPQRPREADAPWVLTSVI